MKDRISFLANTLLVLLVTTSFALLLVKTKGHIALIAFTGGSELAITATLCHDKSIIMIAGLVALFVHTPYAIGVITYAIQYLLDDAPPHDPFWDSFYIITLVFGVLSLSAASAALGGRMYFLYKESRTPLVIVVPETPITSQDNLVGRRAG